MGTRILCLGDIHLGRQPARLEPLLHERGLSSREFSPEAAWNRAVQLALIEKVDALLLAGDVVEDEGDFFEAYTILDRGVRELLGAGIEVCAVAGNHDVRVLPKLAKTLPEFRLLGRGGTWEGQVLHEKGRPGLRVLGWSFPRRVHTESPLADFPGPFEDGLPCLGLLHCDLGAPGSRHAPVSREELALTHPDAWLLGHIHAPDPLAGSRPMGYLGSLVGLDPSETGPHGPWLCEPDPEGGFRIRQLPGMPLRWERIELDVGGLTSPQDLEVELTKVLEARREEIPVHPGFEVLVACRILLVGRTPFYRELVQQVASLETGRYWPQKDEVSCCIEKVLPGFGPARNLADLARSSEPPALLARKLLALEGGGAEALVRDFRRALDRILGQPCWRDLDREVTDERLQDLLRRAGREALEGLLQQGEGG